MASDKQPARTRVAVFDFWGVCTRVVVPTGHDLEHLNYYFMDYIAAEEQTPSVTVTLETSSHSPYMMAPPSRRRVTIHTNDNQDTQVLTGEQTVNEHTPLPPFGLEPLSTRFSTVHAAAVAHPTRPDAALLLHGASTVGKSSIAFELMNRGWRFLSDDTSPIDRMGRVHPFTRPIGIRDRTARRMSLDTDSFRYARSHSTALGRTLSVHPRDLQWVIAAPSKVRWVVKLHCATEFAVTTRTSNTLTIGLDIEINQERAATVIESFCNEHA